MNPILQNTLKLLAHISKKPPVMFSQQVFAKGRGTLAKTMQPPPRIPRQSSLVELYCTPGKRYNPHKIYVGN